MTYFVGLASGAFGVLLIGFFAALILTRRLDATGDRQDALLEDVRSILGQHVPALIAALDRHGMAVQRHGRILAAPPAPPAAPRPAAMRPAFPTLGGTPASTIPVQPTSPETTA